MFKITVEGRTLEELKNNLENITNELYFKGPNKPVEAFTGGQDLKRVEEPAPTPLVKEVVLPVHSVDGVSLAVPTAATGSVELDTDGLPWDARIHSSSKAKTTKGKWKKRKNLPEGEYERVMQELKGFKVEQPAQPVEAPAIPAVPAAPVVETPQAVAQPAAVEAPATPGQFKHSLETFTNNMGKILTDLMMEGKVDQNYLQSLCEYFGVPVIWEVKEDPAKTKELYEKLVEFGIIEVL